MGGEGRGRVEPARLLSASTGRRCYASAPRSCSSPPPAAHAASASGVSRHSSRPRETSLVSGAGAPACALTPAAAVPSNSSRQSAHARAMAARCCCGLLEQLEARPRWQEAAEWQHAPRRVALHPASSWTCPHAAASCAARLGEPERTCGTSSTHSTKLVMRLQKNPKPWRLPYCPQPSAQHCPVQGSPAGTPSPLPRPTLAAMASRDPGELRVDPSAMDTAAERAR